MVKRNRIPMWAHRNYLAMYTGMRIVKYETKVSSTIPFQITSEIILNSVYGLLMADVHEPETRSYNMNQIKGKDTKPEMP